MRKSIDLTVALATIMFPYLMCMSLAAMMAGMLNSLRRYFAAAVAPVFLNIILIGVLVYAWHDGLGGLEIGYALAWGVLAAGLVQLGIVWIAVRHAGVRIGFRRPRLTPNVKRLLVLAFPAAITGGITQINQLIGTAIASGKESAVSSLAYADRVYQLPLGVVGIAVAIVLLPELARALKAGDLKEASNLQNRSVEFTLFLTLPAAAALMVISEPIVRLLYERGAFAATNGTPVVSAILAIFGLGLPAFVLIKAFTPGYFAREDTRTPMFFAAISVAVNISVALTLVSVDGRIGIAIASAVAGWVNAALLFGTLVRRGHWGRDAGLVKRVPRLLVAAAVMAGALYLAARWFAASLGRRRPLLGTGHGAGRHDRGCDAALFRDRFAIGGADMAMVRRSIRRPPVVPRNRLGVLAGAGRLDGQRKSCIREAMRDGYTPQVQRREKACSSLRRIIAFASGVHIGSQCHVRRTEQCATEAGRRWRRYCHASSQESGRQGRGGSRRIHRPSDWRPEQAA